MTVATGWLRTIHSEMKDLNFVVLEMISKLNEKEPGKETTARF
jgi:hypothetical protein